MLCFQFLISTVKIFASFGGKQIIINFTPEPILVILEKIAGWAFLFIITYPMEPTTAVEVRNWFAWAASLFLGLLIIYVTAHWVHSGAEVVKLSKQEIADVNLIVFGSIDSVKTTVQNNVPA